MKHYYISEYNNHPWPPSIKLPPQLHLLRPVIRPVKLALCDSQNESWICSLAISTSASGSWV